MIGQIVHGHQLYLIVLPVSLHVVAGCPYIEYLAMYGLLAGCPRVPGAPCPDSRTWVSASQMRGNMSSTQVRLADRCKCHIVGHEGLQRSALFDVDVFAVLDEADGAEEDSQDDRSCGATFAFFGFGAA